MAATSHQLLSAALNGGLVLPDVMDKIWNISNIPLVLTDLCAKGTHSNRKAEFTVDELATQVSNNAAVEGADVTRIDNVLSKREGNYTQIATKGVKMTDTAEAANSIGGVGRAAYQLKERQKELKRDIEAQMCSHQASVAGDASSVAGISAGIGAQLKTNVKFGATGAVGGFNYSTGLYVAPTPGTKRALSETLIRDVLQDIYVAGGNTSLLMARPVVIRKLSEYLFTSTARVATLTSEQEQNSPSALTAYGSVNVMVTDFGQTVQMRDNRLQLVDTTATSSMYFIDPSKLKQSFLRGVQAERLAKTGLSDSWMLSAQYSFLIMAEKSQGAILAIDEALTVVA